jgi:tetratricopeptide (TPR) repeat protein
MMKDIQIADQAWSDFRQALRTSHYSADVFVVHGPTVEMAVQVPSLLEDLAAVQATCSYFLNTGNERFRVPCYAPSVEKVCTPEPLETYPLLTKKRPQQILVQECAVKELEQRVLHNPDTRHVVVMEYLTSPTPNDRAFIALLLQSSSLRQIPMLIFLHEPQVFHPQPLESTTAELLCMLYLCGGRIRESEWLNLVGCGKELASRLIATRWIGTEQWVCLAHRAVAEQAEQLYASLSQERKCQMAQRLLHYVPNHTGYPILAIAAETGDLGLMLSRHCWEMLEAAFLEPNSMVRYFAHLQRAADQQEKPLLATIAYTHYLIVLTHMDRNQKLHAYHTQRADAARPLDARQEADFWFALGDYLAHMSQPEDWQVAEDCLQRSRECTQNRFDAGEIHRAVYRIHFSNIANAEALIAYKRRQGERARLCEEQALAEAKLVTTTLYYQILLRVNLGDILLRLLGDTEAALAQYTEALTIVLHIPEKLKRWAETRKGEKNELRAAQRLGDALLLVNRNEEAIQAFEALLSRLREAIHQSEARRTALILRARLSLARAYLKARRPRSAAACYLLILRQTAWLDLAVLQDAAEQVRTLQPGLHERVQQRIDGILALGEQRMAEIACVEDLLLINVFSHTYQTDGEPDSHRHNGQV